jgi:asparagine synthase (glutamine-hydrolysing)
MCGIFGFIDTNYHWHNHEELIFNMASQVKHRGPDNFGSFHENEIGLSFGHQRLSIIDLSDSGSQPMISRSKRFVITYNGEIYNCDELRGELADHNIKWNGTSDTEVIINMFEIFGIEKTIPKLTGMFAISVYDKKNKTLFLIRDRIGEKPLYYGRIKNNFVFASELKSLQIIPGFKKNINHEAVSSYFNFSYVPAPLSIYDDIYKLKQGCFLSYNIKNGKTKVQKYWDYNSLINQKINFPFDNFNKTKNHLKNLIKKSVQKQMIADVSLGAFLSGGIDSSLIVSAMQSISSKKIKTFTIGFPETNNDETENAKKIAAHLGTEHFSIMIEKKHMLNIFPKISDVYDEPFSDSSQVPTYLVSKIAKQKVTVALSGDGGDELFGGYQRYQSASDLYVKYKSLPKLLNNFSLPFSDYFGLGIKKNFLNRMQLIYNINKYGCNDFSDFYEFVSLGHNHYSSDLIITDKHRLRSFKTNKYDSAQDLMNHDILNYLADDILVKVDRAAMSHSLETRVPLLDHQIVEFASHIPIDFKIKNGQSKYILKQILSDYVPNEMFDNPKKGFGLPLNYWLRNDLKQWATEIIFSSDVRINEFLNLKRMKKLFSYYLNGADYLQTTIWDCLIFITWFNKNK